jgi:hypothetical protein
MKQVSPNVQSSGRDRVKDTPSSAAKFVAAAKANAKGSVSRVTVRNRRVALPRLAVRPARKY